MKTKRNSTRDSRRWAELDKMLGPGIHKLPSSFKHGLYHLRTRGKLPDAELVLAFQRCKAWLARAKKDGLGTCECGCQTRLAVDATNAKKQSVWCLDHDPRNKRFRGILTQKCNTELGDGDRRRKWSHASYIDAHEARMRQDTMWQTEYAAPWQAEWPPPGVLD